MRASWYLVFNARAGLVVSSRDHGYERVAPQRSVAVLNLTRGIRQFVVGTGGTALEQFNIVKVNSEVRYSDARGVLKLTLHPSSYDWKFLAAAGTFIDEGTANCV